MCFIVLLCGPMSIIFLDEYLAAGFDIHDVSKNYPRSCCHLLPGALQNTHLNACAKVIPSFNEMYLVWHSEQQDKEVCL